MHSFKQFSNNDLTSHLRGYAYGFYVSLNLDAIVKTLPFAVHSGLYLFLLKQLTFAVNLRSLLLPDH